MNLPFPKLGLLADTGRMDKTFNPPLLSTWAEEVRADPSPQWLVPDLIPADNLILLSGHPKDAKKTWFAMYAALEAAKRGHKVLYVYREGARRPTLNRFEALCKNQDCFKNIYFHHRGGFWLDEGHWVKHTADFIRQNGVSLAIIDTFAKSMQSDENSSQHVGRAVQSAECLRDSGATVVLVHHLRKANHSLSNGDSGQPEPDKDLRGSSALAGAYETHWAIRSYPTLESKEPQTFLLIGGKEIEWSAYSYEWDFQSEGDNLITVSLQFDRMGEMPYIPGKDEDTWG